MDASLAPLFVNDSSCSPAAFLLDVFRRPRPACLDHTLHTSTHQPVCPQRTCPLSRPPFLLPGLELVQLSRPSSVLHPPSLALACPHSFRGRDQKVDL